MLGQTQENAFSAAFRRRGVRPEDAEIQVHLARYLNVTDGNKARLLEQVRIAIGRLSAEAATPKVPEKANDALPLSSDKQTEEGAGQNRDAANSGHGLVSRSSSSSSNRDGAGQPNAAKHGHEPVARTAREPSSEQRAADLKVRTASATVALTVFDRYKTSAGDAWGDVKAHELTGMTRDGIMAMALSHYIGPLAGNDRFKTVRELISPSGFEDVVSRVRGKNDAA